MTDDLQARVMAFADNRLPFHEWGDVLEALHKDHELLRFYKACVDTRDLGEVYGEALGPVPERLLAAMAQLSAALAAVRQSTPARAGRNKLAQFLVGFRLPPLWAFAGVAAATLVAVGALGWFVSSALRDDSPTLQTGRLFAPLLQQALEKTKSGAFASAVPIVPTMSFPTHDKRWCRQFDVVRIDDSMRSIAIACRDDNGRWRIEEQTAAMPYKPTKGEYRPVAQNPKTIEAERAIERLRSRIMVGDAIVGDEEQKHIDGGWKKLP